jgi:hypothetical protein
MSKNRWAGRSMASAFVLIAICFLVYILSRSISEQIYHTSAQNKFQHADRSSLAQISFDTPMGYWKNNPAYYEKKGDFHSLLGRNKRSDIANQENAVMAYRRAVNLAPAKAQYWVKLARAKAIARQFDEEFYFSYRRAFEYGGWEYHINHALIKIGLAYWYSMSVDSRQILKQAVTRTYSVQPRYVFDVAREYGQLTMVCLWLRAEGNAHQVCERQFTDRN